MLREIKTGHLPHSPWSGSPKHKAGNPIFRKTNAAGDVLKACRSSDGGIATSYLDGPYTGAAPQVPAGPEIFAQPVRQAPQGRAA
ncbi:MAG: hypothetical protein FD129_779 [bacterium]|nr:MAG: hypothetical protein FD129_779 [bacterium]